MKSTHEVWLQTRQFDGKVTKGFKFCPDTDSEIEIFGLSRNADRTGMRHKVLLTSLDDIFDPELVDSYRDKVFGYMAGTPHLDWIVETEYLEQARLYWAEAPRERKWTIARSVVPFMDTDEGLGLRVFDQLHTKGFLENVWIMAPIQSQDEMDLRIRALLKIPAKAHLLHCRLTAPLNAPLFYCPTCHVPCFPILVNNDKDYGCSVCRTTVSTIGFQNKPGLPQMRVGVDQIICTGDDGEAAQPLEPVWVKNLRDECVAGGVPFLFESWGEWAPMESIVNDGTVAHAAFFNNAQMHLAPGAERLYRVGKERSGRLLDGREWTQYPEFRKGCAE